MSIASVRDRVVAAVSAGVDGNDVGAVGQWGASGYGQLPVVLVENGQLIAELLP
jgi:hypothetical protein